MFLAASLTEEEEWEQLLLLRGSFYLILIIFIQLSWPLSLTQGSKNSFLWATLFLLIGIFVLWGNANLIVDLCSRLIVFGQYYIKLVIWGHIARLKVSHSANYLEIFVKRPKKRIRGD